MRLRQQVLVSSTTLVVIVKALMRTTNDLEIKPDSRKMKFIKRIYPIVILTVAVLVLGACGQRSESTATTGADGDQVASVDEGAIVFGPNGEVLNSTDPELGAALASALTVHVISDVSSIPTGGGDAASITVLVTDNSNRASSDQEIEFISSGGVLQDIISITDLNGEASAVLNLGRDYRNQDILIEAIAGGTVGSVLISTNGSEIEVEGDDLLVAGDSAELTITLTDGNEDPISNQEVLIQSASGNTITPATGVTNSEGHFIVEVDSASGSDIISVSALEGTVTANHEITVANDILTFESPARNDELQVGGIEAIEVLWESEGSPVANEDLRFSLTAGQIIGNPVVTTDSSGRASISITSNSAGPVRVSAEADGSGDPTAKLDFEFVATTPSLINLNASSTRVPTGETSTLTALVTDANGNPVKNMEVVFASPDLRGGQINPASAISNSDGEASVTFTAGSLATEFEAIQIVSQVVNTSIADSVVMTAFERVLNVTIGSTDLIRSLNGQTQYSLPFVVQVADGSGSPLEEASIEMSIRPLFFTKGFYRLVNSDGVLPENLAAVNPGASFSPAEWARTSATFIECIAEDSNGNRLLDAGEDTNNNGILDPQDPAIVAADSENTPTLENGVITTDATGSGFFAIIYPQSNAQWASVEVTARARALGAEAEASFITDLPVLAEEIRDVTTSVPNQFSPYGTSLNCMDTL